MSIHRKHIYYFVGFSIICALTIFPFQKQFSARTSASAISPLPSLNATGTDTVEETVTLSPARLKTFSHGNQWWTGPSAYCGPPFHLFPALDEAPASVVAGFEHYYDKGTPPFPCPDGASAEFRGGVWFDLSGITSKAPPLHVFVTSAKLGFKTSHDCAGSQLLIAQEDWSTDYPGDKLLPGDAFAAVGACASGGCAAIDVSKILNNWIRGPDRGGAANYGFVFKGEIEGDLHWTDNDVCLTRYSDLTLTVTYKYDKASTPIILYVPPPGSRMNVALASNGGVASASSILSPGFPASGANDGDRKGTNWGSGGGWADATSGAFPDWLQIDFSSAKTIDEIDVFTLQDNFAAPLPVSEGMTFAKFGLTDFDIQYWDGTTWQTVPGGNITGNKLIWTKLSLTKPITTSKIKLVTKAAIDNGYSRVTEVEAWGK